MDIWFQTLESLQITSPFLLSAGIGLLLVLVIGIARKRRNKKDEVESSAVEDIKEIGAKRARRSALLKYSAFGLMVVLLSVALAGPKSEFKTSTSQTKTQFVRNVLLVIDISGSMKSEYGGFVKENKERDKTSYRAVVESADPFLRKQEDMRVGVIFFSDSPFVWRRPTFQLDELADDLSQTVLKPPSPSEPYNKQLASLSRGTKTDIALYGAARVFAELGEEKELQSKAVILLTDLNDNQNKVAQAMRDLARAGIKVYIITNKSGHALERWRGFFPGSNMVRFFTVESDAEMQEAYNAIDILESEPILVTENTVERHNLAPYLALVLLVFSFFFIVLSERYARQMRGGD